MPNAERQPTSKKCVYCGEGYICEHGKCTVCQGCKKCERELWSVDAER